MIKFNEILSTTMNKKKALYFATNALFVINIKKYLKNANWRRLNAKNALYIENITSCKGEEEVIFPSGTEFIIETVNEHKLMKLLFGSYSSKIIEI